MRIPPNTQFQPVQFSGNRNRNRTLKSLIAIPLLALGATACGDDPICDQGERSANVYSYPQREGGKETGDLLGYDTIVTVCNNGAETDVIHVDTHYKTGQVSHDIESGHPRVGSNIVTDGDDIAFAIDNDFYEVIDGDVRVERGVVDSPDDVDALTEIFTRD